MSHSSEPVHEISTHDKIIKLEQTILELEKKIKLQKLHMEKIESQSNRNSQAIAVFLLNTPDLPEYDDGEYDYNS